MRVQGMLVLVRETVLNRVTSRTMQPEKPNARRRLKCTSAVTAVPASCITRRRHATSISSAAVSCAVSRSYTADSSPIVPASSRYQTQARSEPYPPRAASACTPARTAPSSVAGYGPST